MSLTALEKHQRIAALELEIKDLQIGIERASSEKLAVLHSLQADIAKAKASGITKEIEFDNVDQFSKKSPDEQRRKNAIDNIEWLYPPDDVHERTQELGREDIMNALAACWRELPLPVLEHMAKAQLGREAAGYGKDPDA